MLQTGLGSGGEEATKAAQAARTPSCPHPQPQGSASTALAEGPRDSCDLRHPPPLPRSLGHPGDSWGGGLSLAFTPREVLGLFPASSVVSVL